MKDFSKHASVIRKKVDKANDKARATPTNYTRFHFMSEDNKKGLFSFGVYDYQTKRHAMTDVFDPEIKENLSHMEELLDNLD